jgi:hypothetical protein
MDSLQRWEIYLSSLAKTSRAAYAARVKEYMEWCGENSFDPYDANNVLKYLTHLHDEDIFCAKTLWSISSMISYQISSFETAEQCSQQ